MIEYTRTSENIPISTTEVYTSNDKSYKIPVNITKMEKSLKIMKDTINDGKRTINNIELEFKKFEKYAESFIVNSKKICERKPRKPSGFVMPVNISDELCDFLNIPHGSHAARTEVTKYIIQYITEHNLSHPEKRTLIVPDEKLDSLLGDEIDYETLTRFTIQKYMNKHFHV